MKNVMTKIGDVFKKSGSSFTTLETNNIFVLTEQKIKNNIVAYEVCKLIKSKRYESSEEFLTIPTENQFGLNKFDKSFNKNRLSAAKDYYDLMLAQNRHLQIIKLIG